MLRVFKPTAGPRWPLPRQGNDTRRSAVCFRLLFTEVSMFTFGVFDRESKCLWKSFTQARIWFSCLSRTALEKGLVRDSVPKFETNQLQTTRQDSCTYQAGKCQRQFFAEYVWSQNARSARKGGHFQLDSARRPTIHERHCFQVNRCSILVFEFPEKKPCCLFN